MYEIFFFEPQVKKESLARLDFHIQQLFEEIFSEKYLVKKSQYVKGSKMCSKQFSNIYINIYILITIYRVHFYSVNFSKLLNFYFHLFKHLFKILPLQRRLLKVFWYIFLQQPCQ